MCFLILISEPLKSLENHSILILLSDQNLETRKSLTPQMIRFIILLSPSNAVGYKHACEISAIYYYYKNPLFEIMGL